MKIYSIHDGIIKLVNNKTACVIILSVITILIYFNTLSNNFVYDDYDFIVNNAFIKNLKNIPYFFLSKEAYSSEGNYIIYRPFATLSFAVDYRLWGLNPFGYHIQNILFHALNAMLVFMLLGALFRDNLAALLAALFFAAHPAQTEAVTWISGRSNVLFLFSFVLSFYFWIKYGEKKRVVFYVLSVITFVTALLSKEMAITLPLVLVLYELLYRPAEIRGLAKKIPAMLPYITIVVMYLFMRYSVLEVQSQRVYWGGNFASTVFTMTRSFVKYVLFLIFPIRHNVEPVINVSKSFFKPAVIGSTAIIAVLSAIFIYSFKKHRDIALGIGWFFITMIPVSNLRHRPIFQFLQKRLRIPRTILLNHFRIEIFPNHY